MSGFVFADCEGNNFYPQIDKMWTLQIAEDVEDDVVVYADQKGYRPIEKGLEILHEADKAVFHNGFGYDLWAINKVYPGTLRPEQIVDTLVMSRLLDSTARRHSLGDLGEKLGFPKGHHEDFSQFSEAMAKYGANDVRILQKMWLGDKLKRIPSFGEFYENFRRACDLEFKTAYVIAKQTHHGFRLDVDKCYELEAELRQETVDIERELQEVFPPIVHERWSEKTGKRLKDKVEVFNPGSRQQIAQRLIDRYKWKPKKKTPTGQPRIDETILGELEYPEAQRIARYLTIGKMLGQITDGDNGWLKLAEEKPDGTHYVYGQVNTLGARTHRMSHFTPNMAQVSTKDRRMREGWLPDPDDLLVGIDAEGLELRELAHFLEPYDGGRYIKIVHSGDKSKGTDIHTMNMKDTGLYLRRSAKTMIYAHNYGCFDPKLGLILIEDAKAAGKPIPKGSPSDLGAQLRRRVEVGIVGLGDLIDKCKRAHNRRKALPGHDGRWIPSASEHSALNTLLQGNGSIVMKEALNHFDDEITRLQLLDKVSYCANVHDEFQLSVHPDVAEKVAEVGKWAIARAGETLEVRCPLVGDAAIGKNWAETH